MQENVSVADTAERALATKLEALAVRKAGQGALISGMEPLPGHAGLGFSFYLDVPGQARSRLVIRTIAEGVPAKGPADIHRQARIMESMAGAGVPVPRIVWTEPEGGSFGQPYFVADFVAGYQTPVDWQALTERDRRLGRRAMAALPLIHRAEWRGLEKVWGVLQPLEQEFERLHKLFDRPTIDPVQGGRIQVLRDRLLQSIPRSAMIGCVHGDFHWGNIIFGEDDVRAIVDWEIAFIGPVLLDVGWICFYADEQSFIGEGSARAKRFGLTPDEMLNCYQEAWGSLIPAAEVAWFRAFSAYRFGVITLFNNMLHQRGKRHDPSWAATVLSVPQMAERALELLGR